MRTPISAHMASAPPVVRGKMSVTVVHCEQQARLMKRKTSLIKREKTTRRKRRELLILKTTPCK
jgi:hypothetical protein